MASKERAKDLIAFMAKEKGALSVERTQAIWTEINTLFPMLQTTLMSDVHGANEKIFLEKLLTRDRMEALCRLVRAPAMMFVLVAYEVRKEFPEFVDMLMHKLEMCDTEDESTMDVDLLIQGMFGTETSPDPAMMMYPNILVAACHAYGLCVRLNYFNEILTYAQKVMCIMNQKWSYQIQGNQNVNETTACYVLQMWWKPMVPLKPATISVLHDTHPMDLHVSIIGLIITEHLLGRKEEGVIELRDKLAACGFPEALEASTEKCVYDDVIASKSFGTICNNAKVNKRQFVRVLQSKLELPISVVRQILVTLIRVAHPEWCLL